MAHDGATVLPGCACTKLRRLTRAVTQLYDEALSPTGLTVTQYALLSNLSRLDAPIAIGALAERFGTDPTTLNRTLKPLVARTLVTVAPAPGDRRVRCVALTPAGREAARAARPHWAGAQARLAAALEPETAVALMILLDLSAERLSGPPAMPPAG